MARRPCSFRPAMRNGVLRAWVMRLVVTAYLPSSSLRGGVVAAVLLVGLSGIPVWAQPAGDPHEITPLVSEYCYRCHGPQTQTAGINLSSLVTERPLVKNRETWSRVMEALEGGKMPPASAPQLPGDVRRQMLDLLRRDIEGFDYSTVDNPGFEGMRRLTHAEYDNTVRDLFGVALRVTDRFPSELIGSSGFENSANTLFFPSSLMERYIAAAERVVELALPDLPTTDAHQTSRNLKPSRQLYFSP